MIALKKVIAKIFEPKLRLVLIWILVGLLIRMLLMPLTTHADLLSATWRESLYAFGGNFRISGAVPEFLLCFYLKAVSPLTRELPGLFKPEFFTTGSINPNGYNLFVNSVHSARLLFVLKFPFLLTDLLLLFFAWKLFPDWTRKLRMVAFWALCPLTLYSVYIWGRYEIFGLLFTFLALYFAYRNKSFWSLIFIGLALACRTSYLLILPFLVIYFSKNWKEAIKYSISGLLPVLLISQLISFLGGGSLLPDLTLGDSYKLFFSGQIGSGFTTTSIFPVLYLLVLILFYYDKKRSFFKFSNYSAIAFLTYLSFGYFNPHYPVWIMPFLIIIFAQNRKTLLPMLGLFVSYFLFIEIYYGAAVSWTLFSPLDPSLFPNMSSLAANHLLNIDRYLVVSIFHTLLVIFAGLLAFILYKSRNETKPT
ncbi:MAG: hypothetical protein NTW79_01200 [Candidatus Berkelbacteria bacterium]|nr:hypothetical protein [Candidatus Berkelbacteria bacterium]